MISIFKRIALLGLVLLQLQSFAQDQLKIMSYNLLNFGNITSYCTSSNNNILQKEQYLKTIIDYVKPDIFVACEMGSNSFVHQRVMDSCFNNGRNYYQKAAYSNDAGSDLVEMAVYDSRKLALHSQYVLNSQVRDIVLYRFYYKSPLLTNTHDTAFINVIGSHLKAGSTSSDEQTRTTMVNNAMNWINIHLGTDNVLFLGDLNLKKSSEGAYQSLTQYSNANIRFIDPINKEGNWNNNSYYKDIHSQSTHTSSNGCASGGGLDDRFDLILASAPIINGSDHFTYVNNSYQTLGNDGNHFNGAIISGTNNSAPSNVIQALYNLSDHLPVILKVEVDQIGAGLNPSKQNASWHFRIENPAGNTASIQIYTAMATNLSVEIFDMEGRKLYFEEIRNLNQLTQKSLNVSSLKAGIYLLKIKDAQGNQQTQKWIKR